MLRSPFARREFRAGQLEAAARVHETNPKVIDRQQESAQTRGVRASLGACRASLMPVDAMRGKTQHLSLHHRRTLPHTIGVTFRKNSLLNGLFSASLLSFTKSTDLSLLILCFILHAFRDPQNDECTLREGRMLSVTSSSFPYASCGLAFVLGRQRVTTPDEHVPLEQVV